MPGVLRKPRMAYMTIRPTSLEDLKGLQVDAMFLKEDR